jgi:DMSO/TMAO reductase YedYZ molybdopterin-dependent catalytic subunit
MTAPSDVAGPESRPVRALAGAVAGVLAAAVALGVAQFASGVGVPQSSPVLAVGQAAIDLTPPQVKDFAISAFGTNDKTALLDGIVVILALYAAVVGMLAVRRLAFGMCGLAIFAFIGLWAALSRPNATADYAVPTLAGAAVGAFALTWLARAARLLASPAARTARPGLAAANGVLAPPDLPPAPDAPAQIPKPVFRAGPAYVSPDNPDDRKASRWPARRRFLISSGAAVGVAALGTATGRSLVSEHNVAAARAAIRFPRPAVPAPPLPPGSNLNIPGLSSFITPDNSFYRVDFALLTPQVDPATWRLRIHGMVQREVTITFADLLRRPLIDAYITLTCVSDPVGGPYVGNAKWLGASLADLIRQARPLAGADQLLSTSVDGYTSGTPLQVVLDGRNALLAVAMNDQALPVVHGFPARMVVPGLYGYVSATKWVTDIEVTTFAAWLVAAGADQDRVQDRRAYRRRVAQPGADSGGRGGLGAAQGHCRRRGQGQRRPVA